MCHDAKLQTTPCSALRTMSSGCFSWCLLLKPCKFKSTKTKSEVSINSVCADFLTTNCNQKLIENEIAIISATKEYTSVEDPVTGTNSKSVGNLIHILPTLWRTSESRNCQKITGRSFQQQRSISQPPGNKPWYCYSLQLPSYQSHW